MSLLTNLIAHWKLNEASSTRNDSHGSNHLTDNNTVLAATGKLGDAADFERDNSESLSIADNTDLSTGDIDFTIAGWVNLESSPGSNTSRDIVAKGTTGDYEYSMRVNNTSGTIRFRFLLFTSAQVLTTLSATTIGTPSTATWYFIVCWHDAAANTINIQVNNGTVDSAAHTGGVDDTAGVFRIGNIDPALNYFDGLIDSVSLWKRVLTTDERTALYNSGNGLDYESFASALTFSADSITNSNGVGDVTFNGQFLAGSITNSNTVNDVTFLPAQLFNADGISNANSVGDVTFNGQFLADGIANANSVNDVTFLPDQFFNADSITNTSSVGDVAFVGAQNFVAGSITNLNGVGDVIFQTPQTFTADSITNVSSVADATFTVYVAPTPIPPTPPPTPPKIGCLPSDNLLVGAGITMDNLASLGGFTQDELVSSSGLTLDNLIENPPCSE